MVHFQCQRSACVLTGSTQPCSRTRASDELRVAANPTCFVLSSLRHPTLPLPFASMQLAQGPPQAQHGFFSDLKQALLKLPFMPRQSAAARPASSAPSSIDQVSSASSASTSAPQTSQHKDNQQKQKEPKQRGKKQPKVRFAPVRPPPYVLDQADQELWEAFAEMDTNADNLIDWVELRAALEKLGLPCTPEYLVSMMNEYDLNKDNHIDWDEFRYYVHKREVEIEKAFRMFDRNGDGEISCMELVTVLTEAGIPAHTLEVQNMIERVNQDSRTTISYDEFRRFAAFLPNAARISSSPHLYAAWWQNSKTLISPHARRLQMSNSATARNSTDHMASTGSGALMFAEMLSRFVMVLTVGVLVAHGISDSSGAAL